MYKALVHYLSSLGHKERYQAYIDDHLQAYELIVKSFVHAESDCVGIFKCYQDKLHNFPFRNWRTTETEDWNEINYITLEIEGLPRQKTEMRLRR